jgi:hypothetical protein
MGSGAWNVGVMEERASRGPIVGCDEVWPPMFNSLQSWRMQ